jgi:hypothetical protein
MGSCSTLQAPVDASGIAIRSCDRANQDNARIERQCAGKGGGFGWIALGQEFADSLMCRQALRLSPRRCTGRIVIEGRERNVLKGRMGL